MFLAIEPAGRLTTFVSMLFISVRTVVTYNYSTLQLFVNVAIVIYLLNLVDIVSMQI